MAKTTNKFAKMGTIKSEQVTNFGEGLAGEKVDLITIANGGTTASIMTWGATLQDLRRTECDHALVLGSTDFEAYLGPMLYFGAIVGPVANRVAGGKFELDGKSIELEKNEKGRTTLHGGSGGTGQRNWTLLACDATSCTLRVIHPDRAGGFPGNVTVQAHYALDETGTLSLDIQAQTDQTTHLNFAHHSYWNLDGHADLSNHEMQIAASQYLPVDADLIPTGAPAPVANTAFDYRALKPIAAPSGMALDHNFCVDRTFEGLQDVCSVRAGQMQLDVASTEPGLQVFDASGIDTTPFEGHLGRPYGHHAGLALEPQKWPDAPNQQDFPSTLIQPGETYRQLTQFRITAL